MKSTGGTVEAITAGRAPQGARGLKYKRLANLMSVKRSRPARGAWVEMLLLLHGLRTRFVAPRKGRVG